jgi:hypothetical protein
MIFWIILSVILLLAVIALLYQLNKKTKEKEYWEKQERRSWLLKVALEQSCELPTVEPKELEKIEPEINQMMNGSTSDEELEEKMRQLIMSLYEEKRGHGGKQTPNKKAAGKDDTPPSRPPVTGRGR